MFIAIFSLVVVIFCWAYGDLQIGTKAIFTLFYLATFGLLAIKDAPYLFIISQCVIVAVVGSATFGTDFLNRRMR
jgi:hypothetical protein